jgi:hypothetical protein
MVAHAYSPSSLEAEVEGWLNPRGTRSTWATYKTLPQKTLIITSQSFGQDQG